MHATSLRSGKPSASLSSTAAPSTSRPPAPASCSNSSSSTVSVSFSFSCPCVYFCIDFTVSLWLSQFFSYFLFLAFCCFYITLCSKPWENYADKDLKNKFSLCCFLSRCRPVLHNPPLALLLPGLDQCLHHLHHPIFQKQCSEKCGPLWLEQRRQRALASWTLRFTPQRLVDAHTVKERTYLPTQWAGSSSATQFRGQRQLLAWAWSAIRAKSSSRRMTRRTWPHCLLLSSCNASLWPGRAMPVTWEYFSFFGQGCRWHTLFGMQRPPFKSITCSWRQITWSCGTRWRPWRAWARSTHHQGMPFPPFPTHYVPKRRHLTAMFVFDYWEHKPYLMRKLRAILSGHALAVDHQRKVVKRTISDGVVSSGAQTFTICGDFGVVCGVYVVPDTSLSWAKEALAEVVQRHEVAAKDAPTFLFVDCGCCNGKLHDPHGATGHRDSMPDQSSWQATFRMRLDAMHLMLRLGRQINAEHPCRKKFLIDMSHAIFASHPGDVELLDKARKAAQLEGPPNRTERGKFVRRIVGEPQEVAQHMTLVLKAHRELDVQSRQQAASAGLQVDNSTVANIAYPLITKNLLAVFQQQLVHVLNGCITDDPSLPPNVAVGTVDFHNTGKSKREQTFWVIQVFFCSFID